jgi:hypothetical protein
VSKDFVVTIRGGTERAREWVELFGTTRVCVRSPIPHRANLPGRPGALVYELDLAELTPAARARLVAYLAAKFGIPVAEVDLELEAHGVPILADDCSVAVHNPQRWLT